MLQSLLVPLDGSSFSEGTLPLARGLARATGASLHLAHVHVSHTPDHFLSNTQFHFEGLDMEEYDAHHREGEEAYLREVAEGLGREGLRVDSAMLDGPTPDEIAAHAASVGADMILLTTHARAGLRRIRHGSVADALIRRTRLPVLLLHPHRPDGTGGQEVLSFRNILVPLDGSPRSEAILGPVRDLASATDARITLAHVITSTAIVGSSLYPLPAGTSSPAMRRAVAYLDAHADVLRAEGHAVELRVVEHEIPSRGICWMADDAGADLLALATHGYGGVKRAVLGSVADRVLHDSPLPLLVVRAA